MGMGVVHLSLLFDQQVHLLFFFNDTATTEIYTVNGNGSLSLVSAGASDGQIAACWVIGTKGSFYVANTGSGSLSRYTIDNNGTVTLRNPLAATGIAGAIDMAVSGRFLYAQSGGSGSVKAFAVGEDGSLTPIGSSTVPDGSSQEGIAAA